MTHLGRLQKDRENRIKSEEEEERLRQQVLEAHNLYTLHDNLYLLALEQFNKKFKEEHEGK